MGSVDRGKVELWTDLHLTWVIHKGISKTEMSLGIAWSLCGTSGSVTFMLKQHWMQAANEKCELGIVNPKEDYVRAFTSGSTPRSWKSKSLITERRSQWERMDWLLNSIGKIRQILGRNPININFILLIFKLIKAIYGKQAIFKEVRAMIRKSSRQDLFVF